jgi:hypothetical protein
VLQSVTVAYSLYLRLTPSHPSLLVSLHSSVPTAVFKRSSVGVKVCVHVRETCGGVLLLSDDEGTYRVVVVKCKNVCDC